MMIKSRVRSINTAHISPQTSLTRHRDRRVSTDDGRRDSRGEARGEASTRSTILPFSLLVSASFFICVIVRWATLRSRSARSLPISACSATIFHPSSSLRNALSATSDADGHLLGAGAGFCGWSWFSAGSTCHASAHSLGTSSPSLEEQRLRLRVLYRPGQACCRVYRASAHVLGAISPRPEEQRFYLGLLHRPGQGGCGVCSAGRTSAQGLSRVRTWSNARCLRTPAGASCPDQQWWLQRWFLRWFAPLGHGRTIRAIRASASGVRTFGIRARGLSAIAPGPEEQWLQLGLLHWPSSSPEEQWLQLWLLHRPA